MAAPAFSDSGTAEQQSGTTLSIGLDGGAASENDILVVVIGNRFSPFSAPDGTWTELTSQNEERIAGAAWWKRAGASEPATYGFTGASQRTAGVIVSYSGVDTTTAINATSAIASDLTDTDATVEYNTVTTDEDDTMIVWVQFDNTSAAKSESFANATAVIDVNNAAIHAVQAYEVQASQGTSVSEVNTMSVAGDWMALTVALNPVLGAGPATFPVELLRRKPNTLLRM